MNLDLREDECTGHEFVGTSFLSQSSSSPTSQR